MKKVTPDKDEYAIGGSMGSKKGEGKKHYPTIRIDHKHLKDAKDWKPGESHHLHMHVKMVGNSQSRFQNEGEYEIHHLDHCDKGCDGEEHEHSAVAMEDGKEDADDIRSDHDDTINSEGSEEPAAERVGEE